MRFLWVLKDDAHFDEAKLRRYGITGVFVDPRESWTTRENLQRTVARGLHVGIYTVWNWPECQGMTPEQYADWTIGHTDRLKSAGYTIPRVQMDIELHDPTWVTRAITRFRDFMPNQALSWTMEGMQGGWMDSLFVAYLTAMKVRVVPQPYDGAMNPMDPALVRRDLTSRGFKPARVSLMWDGAHLPDQWSGFCFHQGRLP